MDKKNGRVLQDATSEQFVQLNVWQIISSVKTAAADYGISGDPLKQNTEAGTMRQELLIGHIVASIPGSVRRMAPTLAKRIARNLVLGGCRNE